MNPRVLFLHGDIALLHRGVRSLTHGLPNPASPCVACDWLLFPLYRHREASLCSEWHLLPGVSSKERSSPLTESIHRPLLLFPVSLEGEAFCPFLAFTSSSRELGQWIWADFLPDSCVWQPAGKLRAQGSQTWSQRRRLGTSACIETVLSRSHIHVPTWKEISRAALHGRGGFDLQAVGLEVGDSILLT